MKVHHLNCGCMCPPGGALYDGFSKGLHAHLVCHCLLIETDRDGLVLVDTGFGRDDIRQPEQRLSGFFRLINNIQRREELTARSRIEALGFSAADVRHIILTHLDFDHAGGLTDFPDARIHLLQREIDTAQQRHSWLLHGGDAWFYRDEMRQQKPHCTPGLRFYQWMMAMDNGARCHNQQRLRDLSNRYAHEITFFCSHDALELKNLIAQSESE